LTSETDSRNLIEKHIILFGSEGVMQKVQLEKCLRRD
jgi:hypothetical protein